MTIVSLTKNNPQIMPLHKYATLGLSDTTFWLHTYYSHICTWQQKHIQRYIHLLRTYLCTYSIESQGLAFIRHPSPDEIS